MNNQIGNFGFKIVNADAVSRVIVLLPGSFPVLGVSGAAFGALVVHHHDTTEIAASGLNAIDYVLDDGVIDGSAAKVTCTALNAAFSIQHFLQFIKNNPRTCQQLVIQADNVDVYNEQIVIRDDNPTGGTSNKYIPLQTYYSANQFQSDKITINNAQLPLNSRAFMYITIPAGRTVTFHLNQIS